VDDIEIASPAPGVDLLALDEALSRFARIEPKQVELVKLRYFIGLTIEESAEVLGISVATAKRWWSYSKAWLFHEMS
jgi:DNA-directed RNA polymerase specialized sigma24 family protein